MNITEALKAAGWTDTAISMASEQEMQRMERFAKIIRNQALEEAASECDGVYYQHLGPECGEVRYGVAACSAAIRSMKKDQPCP